MEIGGYLSIAKRWWWTLLVATWVAALAGFVVASRLPPTYEASVSLLVGPINTDVNTLRASDELVQTYATLATSQPLLESTIQELGLTMTPAQLQPQVKAQANNVTRFLTIRVDQPKAAAAARIANGLANELVLIASKGTTRPEGQLQITDPAAPPTSPIAPQVGLIVLLAAAAGLLGAIVVVLLTEYLSETIRTREDLVRLAPVPVLATLGGSRSGFAGGASQLAVEAAPSSRQAATLRLLSAKIAYVDATHPASAILILGSQPGDNVPEVAANVAASIALTGRPTTLIDTDPAGPGVTELLGFQGRSGLSDTLAEGAPLARYSVPRTPDLSVLPRGTKALPDNVDAEIAERILRALTAPGGAVVIAGGAVTTSASGLTWARLADVTVLVVDRDRTRRDNVSYAVETLRLVKANLVGTVLSLRHQRRTRPMAAASPSALPVATLVATPVPAPVAAAVKDEPPAAVRPGASQRRSSRSDVSPGRSG